jgi:hypothetical protein
VENSPPPMVSCVSSSYGQPYMILPDTSVVLKSLVQVLILPYPTI